MIVRGTPMDRKIRSQIRRFAAAVTIMAGACTLQAGSATWNLNPVNNHWGKAANWTPATVPYGENDVATFGTSNVTDVMLGDTPDGYATNTVAEVAFLQDASAYAITLSPVTRTVYSTQLVFYGAGITNNSGAVQNFIATSSLIKGPGQFYFLESSSAGENVAIINEGAPRSGTAGGSTRFWDSSNADSATVTNEGSTASDSISGGFTALLDSSNAESATFINNGGGVSGAAAGYTLIQVYPPGGNLGTSTFIANPAMVPGAEGGWVEMDVGTCAGTRFIANGATVADCQAGQIYAYGAENGTGLGVATFIGNGGNGSGAQGGLIDVFNLPLSDQTMVIANAGMNGGLGGTILIEGTPARELDLPQFKVFGNGVLDLTNVTDQTMPIGSLAGNGMVLLAGHTLSVGNNNLSTTFAGIIQESGGLTKAGTGTLTLTGANTYSGPTTVTAGTLRVNNSTGSGTGSGPVKIQAGAVGGTGTIGGQVTIGTGNGPGAVLAPSVQGRQLAILTLQQGLTFKGDGSYSYKLNANSATADQVIANRVNIQSGAQFSFQLLGNRRLPIGTTFIAISNTAGTPISGAFANLPDGSTFTAGRNNYQASYEGGDGNDLTLTVVP
jgi:autotransporter-associated beta strand protein